MRPGHWRSAQEFKIGVVNPERLLRESTPARAALTKLEAEFSKRQKDVEETGARLKAAAERFEKDSPVMTETDRGRRQRELAELDRDFQRKQREFREDLNQRRNEEMQSLQERSTRIIRQIAEQEKFDLIVQEAVYFNPRIDITERVLKALNARPIVEMKKAVSVSLADLNSAVVERSAGRLQAIVVGPTDVKLSGVAPLAVATRSDLAFLANPLYRADALTTQAGAIVLSAADRDALQSQSAPLTASLTAMAVCEQPYVWFAYAAQILRPNAPVKSRCGGRCPRRRQCEGRCVGTCRCRRNDR